MLINIIKIVYNDSKELKDGNYMLKKTKFNNGDVVDFEIIKENREQAVKEICEGNQGLEKLMNTCLDLNVTTCASCGDHDPYISFVYNKHTEKYLINIIKVFESLGYRSRKYYDLSIMNSNNNTTVSIYINAKGIDTSSFFYFIDDLIHKFNKITSNSETDNLIIMDLMIKLKSIFSYSAININLSDRVSKEYPYILVIGGINKDNEEITENILALNNQTFIDGKNSYRINCPSFHQIIQIYNYLNNEKHSYISK